MSHNRTKQLSNY